MRCPEHYYNPPGPPDVPSCDVCLQEARLKLEARIAEIRALCNEAIAGGHVEAQRCELPCLACLAEDVLSAAEGKP